VAVQPHATVEEGLPTAAGGRVPDYGTQSGRERGELSPNAISPDHGLPCSGAEKWGLSARPAQAWTRVLFCAEMAAWFSPAERKSWPAAVLLLFEALRQRQAAGLLPLPARVPARAAVWPAVRVGLPPRSPTWCRPRRSGAYPRLSGKGRSAKSCRAQLRLRC